MKEAVSDTELIFMTLASFGQEYFFQELIPHLKDGQVIFLMTGNLGSLRLHNLLKEQAKNVDITIYETNNQPYATRVVGPALVHLHHGFGPWVGINSTGEGLEEFQLAIAALPAKKTDAAIKEFMKLYPLTLPPLENVLATTLTNYNIPVHPTSTILNTGTVERRGDSFRLHREGHTPSVMKIEAAVSMELNKLGDAMGITKMKLSDTGPKKYYEYNRRVPIEQTTIGPTTMTSRYVTEDVPFGLVPLSELGEKIGVATPLIDAFIEIASVINGEDYRETGRTLATLGLADMNKEQIVKLLNEGD
jgi:opine dehydrogenase